MSPEKKYVAKRNKFEKPNTWESCKLIEKMTNWSMGFRNFSPFQLNQDLIFKIHRAPKLFPPPIESTIFKIQDSWVRKTLGIWYFGCYQLLLLGLVYGFYTCSHKKNALKKMHRSFQQWGCIKASNKLEKHTATYWQTRRCCTATYWQTRRCCDAHFSVGMDFPYHQIYPNCVNWCFLRSRL